MSAPERELLRVRRLKGAPGVGPDRLIVHCPATRMLVLVDTCAVCPHARMLSLDTTGYGSFVKCLFNAS